MKNSTLIIINADDFGLNENVNQAIIQSFLSGYINSTSLMAGMPGFEQAIELAKRNNVSSSIGVHLNLTEGFPLLGSLRTIPSLVDSNGQFKFSASRRTLHLSSNIKQAIYQEFSCQIEKCIRAGIVPTHLDSHHHIHNIWPIGTIVIGLAKKYKIPFVRIARNYGYGVNLKKWLFKSIYNYRLKSYGLARTELMGSFTDYYKVIPKPNLSIEIMVHPILDKSNIIDSLEYELLSNLSKRL